jgi:hypothetical protein
LRFRRTHCDELSGREGHGGMAQKPAAIAVSDILIVIIDESPLTRIDWKMSSCYSAIPEHLLCNRTRPAKFRERAFHSK